MVGGLIFSLFWDAYKRHVDISERRRCDEPALRIGSNCFDPSVKTESFMLEVPMDFYMPSILESEVGSLSNQANKRGCRTSRQPFYPR